MGVCVMKIHEKLKKSYDILSKHYEFDVDTKTFNAYYERPAMIKAIGKIKNLRVLDAGCGAGYYTKWLIDNNAKEVVAIDFSKKMVEATKRKVENKAHVLELDLNAKLPFNNNYFDMIVSALTLHYVKDLNFTLSEFKRVLKENGVLIFSINHPIMTYLYFSLENYFEEILLEDLINKVPVYFYHRSFDTIFDALYNNNFFVVNMYEPKPTKDFLKMDEKNYKKLMKKPNFLIIKAIKSNVTK
ncbi:ubiquinone biosynthesis methyltransferase UbiE [Marinitoga sp. 1155]|nr:ubiquinone biosynthesis methyltransferase UbiE [Marinitoga sp. 1155]